MKLKGRLSAASAGSVDFLQGLSERRTRSGMYGASRIPRASDQAVLTTLLHR